MERSKMMTIRRNHAVELYKSLKKENTIEDVEGGLIIVTNESGAKMLCEPSELKPMGYEDGTIFFVQEFSDCPINEDEDETDEEYNKRSKGYPLKLKVVILSEDGWHYDKTDFIDN